MSPRFGVKMNSGLFCRQPADVDQLHALLKLLEITPDLWQEEGGEIKRTPTGTPSPTATSRTSESERQDDRKPSIAPNDVHTADADDADYNSGEGNIDVVGKFRVFTEVVREEAGDDGRGLVGPQVTATRRRRSWTRRRRR